MPIAWAKLTNPYGGWSIILDEKLHSDNMNASGSSIVAVGR